MAIFSFYGVEIVAVTSGEAENPKQAIPHALKSMVLRLTLFYVLALGIMVAYLPWTEAGAKVVQQSPFVKLFAHAGIAQAGGHHELRGDHRRAVQHEHQHLPVLAHAVLAVRGGYAPGFVGKLTANGTPLRATLISGAGVLATTSVLLQPARLQLPVRRGAVRRHLRLDHDPGHAPALPSRLARRRAAGTHAVFPIAQITGIALLVGILVTMGLDTEFWNISWIIGVPWLIGVSLAYVSGAGGRDRRRAGGGAG